MLDTLLERPFFLNRHREAPLLKERETFLHHLQQQGTSRAALQDLSNELLHVVRLLKLDEMRDVALEEIQRAAQCCRSCDVPGWCTGQIRRQRWRTAFR
jgi:integrase/recombinase XerD